MTRVFLLLSTNMTLTRQQKETIVADTQEALQSTTAMVLVSFDKLTVEESRQLRDQLSEAGGNMRVVPKRLLKIIFSNIKFDIDPTALDGQLAVAWGQDPVTPAKTLNEFAKEHEEKLTLLSGTLEGSVLTLEEVKELAALPTREQLIGQLLSVLNGPARGFASVLSGVQRSTVQVLQAIVDKKS